MPRRDANCQSRTAAARERVSLDALQIHTTNFPRSGQAKRRRARNEPPKRSIPKSVVDSAVWAKRTNSERAAAVRLWQFRYANWSSGCGVVRGSGGGIAPSSSLEISSNSKHLSSKTLKFRQPHSQTFRCSWTQSNQSLISLRSL